MGRRFYILWLFAATLGAVGAAADIAWHFSRLFDEFSPPHNIATVGFILNLGLLFWALVLRRHELGDAERTALMLSAGTLVAYLITIPLDLAWHLIFGVDITAWSPTHLMLFYSAWLGQLAMLLAWLSSPSARARGAWIVTFVIGLLQLSSGLFPLGQQEYGAVALDSLTRTGRAPWYVAPDMWALAGTQAERLARGGAPDWVYLVHMSALAGFCLALAACLIRAHGSGATLRPVSALARWYTAGAATGLTAAYLLFRLVMRAIFFAVHLPVSALPWWLFAISVPLDLSLVLAPRLATITFPTWAPFPLWATARTRQTTVAAALGGVLGSLALYATLTILRAAHAVVPATQAATVPLAMLVGGVGAAGGVLLAARMLQFAATAPRPATEPLLALAPDEPAPQAASLHPWRVWAAASLHGRRTAGASSPGTPK